MATRLWSVVFDAGDQRSLASFWAETLGWRLKHNESYSSVARGEGFRVSSSFPSPNRRHRRTGSTSTSRAIPKAIETRSCKGSLASARNM